MADRQRIVASSMRGAGRPVTRGKAANSKREVPGAVLSRAKSDALQQALRKIDEAQHAALAAGDRYYLGARPYGRTGR